MRLHRLLLGVLLPVVIGCAESPLEPVRFATTRGAPESLFDPFHLQGSWLDAFAAAPFSELQRGLSSAIGRPTQFETLQPFQIHAHLATGRVQFAFVDADDENEVVADGAGKVIARPVFAQEAPTCTALFVVPKDSPIKDLSELKGKRVAFGPPNHPALHWAALKAIKEAGVEEKDLAKQVLPIPGSLQFHINSLEAAKAALFKLEADVGVVDEAEYTRWPETGGNALTSALSISISQDQLRVIGRTEPVPMFPSGAVVASSGADPKLVEKVCRYLTETLPTKERITKPLGLVSYEAPKREAQETAGAQTTNG
jgi:ABC-type phosphate/phosphonate transport system substrate-binding protein